MDYDFNDWLIQRIMEYIPSGYVRVGKEINCRCPICGDSRKSKTKKRGYLEISTGRYYCQNCGASFGNGMSFLAAISGDDFSKIRGEYMKIKYSGRYGSNLSTDLSCSANQGVKKATGHLLSSRGVVKSEWKNPLSDNARKYLDGRLVTSAPFLYDPLFSYFDKNRNEYILIPWVMNGTESYFQLNDFQKISKSGRKYIFPRNMDKLLYGLDNIDMSWKHIIVTEGVYDSLFIPNCVCCGGKYLTELQYEIIKKRFPNFKISLSFDNDEPGMDAMRSAISKFGNRYSYFIWFDHNTKEKDINDYVLSHNDPNIFNDKKMIESRIYNGLIARMKFDNV